MMTGPHYLWWKLIPSSENFESLSFLSRLCPGGSLFAWHWYHRRESLWVGQGPSKGFVPGNLYSWSLPDPAEVKWTYIAIGSDVCQRNIFCKLACNKFLRHLDRPEVILFKIAADLKRMRIADFGNHLFYHFDHQLINLQLRTRTSQGELYNVEMYKFKFCICPN